MFIWEATVNVLTLIEEVDRCRPGRVTRSAQLSSPPSPTVSRLPDLSRPHTRPLHKNIAVISEKVAGLHARACASKVCLSSKVGNLKVLKVSREEVEKVVPLNAGLCCAASVTQGWKMDNLRGSRDVDRLVCQCFAMLAGSLGA